MLRALTLFILFQAFLLVLPATVPQYSAYAKAKPAAYGAQKWREKKGAITNGDRERLAKFTAYLGGRSNGKDGRNDAAASLSIKGDLVFNKHLKDNRLELLDSIDNYTGLQVVLVRDKDTGRVFVLPRGTEADQEKIRDVAKADLGSFYSGQLKIGKEQYESGKQKIAGLIKKYKGNVEVIGHSLGGAIAQRIFLDNAVNISSVTVFNSPGLELETVNNALSEQSQLKHLTNPDGSRKLNIFNVKNDIVGSGGGIIVPGNVVMAEGGPLAEGWGNAHTKLIFGPDVKREPMDYYRYQSWRDRSGFIAEDVTKDLARAWFNITNFKSPIKNELRDLLSRLTDYENAILRDVDRKERDKWRKSKKKKRGKDKKPNLDKIVTAVIDKTQLDVEKGRKPPTKKKKKKVVKKPKKKILKQSTPPAGGMSGAYAGKLTGTNFYDGELISEILDGKFSFTIDGTKVTGSLEGTIKKKDVLPTIGSNRIIYFMYAFKGKISGKYHPEAAAVDASSIRAKITGKWNGQGEHGIIDDGSFRADREPNGFVGSWMVEGIGNRFPGGSYYGDWKDVAKNVTVTKEVKKESSKLVGWDAYMCKTYTDDWDQMARMGIHCE